MTSSDRMPLMVDSSDSDEEDESRRRRRRPGRTCRRPRRPKTISVHATAAETGAAPGCLDRLEQLGQLCRPVQIQVRRCSRAGPLSCATSSVRSTPDLRVDAMSEDEVSTRGSSPRSPRRLLPGGQVCAGTPPERKSRRLEGPHHSRSQSCRAARKTDYLAIPGAVGRCRSQLSVCTNDVITGTEAEGQEYYRLRQFSVTGKGVVNCGDLFRSRRSRSNISVASDCSEYSGSSRGRSMPYSGGTSMASSANSSCLNLTRPRPYTGLMLGATGVGKTSLIHQFMTSDYMNAYEASLDDEYGEKSVSVLLDGEESELVFVDLPDGEMSLDESVETHNPDAFIVVYSVTEQSSVQYADHILQTLWKMSAMSSKAVILVGSKSDLVRSRVISSEDGRKLANMYDCKFIEVSGGLDHRVDELLVGILSQIRLKRQCKLGRSRSLGRHTVRLQRGTRHTSSVKGLLNVVCGTEQRSKSCENLQAP